jgi:hypothetical protein
MSYLICGIHDKRPKVCREFPQVDNYIPDTCGYHFSGGAKRGCCYLECQASCCMLPREGGEPGGTPLPEIAGGEPCKYLETVDEPPKGAVVEKPEE